MLEDSHRGTAWHVRHSVLDDVSSLGFALADGGFVDATDVEHPSVGGAADGMPSTGRDLLRFGAALFDGTLLSPECDERAAHLVALETLTAIGQTS